MVESLGILELSALCPDDGTSMCCRVLAFDPTAYGLHFLQACKPV